MKMRLGRILFVAVAAIGLAALVCVRSGWANYAYERWRYGDVIHVSSQCYGLPSDWTLLPGGRVEVSDLRRHFASGGTEAMASVLPVQMVAGLKNLGANATPIGNGFLLHDLGASAPGGLRYIAQSDAMGLALLGSTEMLVRELAAGLAPCR